MVGAWTAHVEAGARPELSTTSLGRRGTKEGWLVRHLPRPVQAGLRGSALGGLSVVSRSPSGRILTLLGSQKDLVLECQRKDACCPPQDSRLCLRNSWGTLGTPPLLGGKAQKPTWGQSPPVTKQSQDMWSEGRWAAPATALCAPHKVC